MIRRIWNMMLTLRDW